MQVAELAHSVEYPADTQITQAGEHADTLYCIAEGIVRSQVPIGDGTQIMILSSADICGWAGLISPYRYLCSSYAVTASRLIHIPLPQLRAYMDQDLSAFGLINRQAATLALRQIEQLLACGCAAQPEYCPT